jgi:lysophospholipase L1-like esterase
MRAVRRGASLTISVLLLAVAVTGCAMGEPFLPPVPLAVVASPSPSAAPSPVRIGVVGDSLSSGGVDEALPSDPGAWTDYLRAPYEVAGGWAQPGATSSVMADGLRPFSADVVVILAGTNDVMLGVPADQTLQNILRIRGTADAPAVVLSAVPPSASFGDRAAALNTSLAALAKEQGWTFVDPWKDVRRGNGWVPGVSPDGIHPNLTGYAKAAGSIEQAVHDALDGSGVSAAGSDKPNRLERAQ